MFMKLTAHNHDDVWIWFDRGTTLERQGNGTMICLNSGQSIDVQEAPEEIIARLFPGVVAP